MSNEDLKPLTKEVTDKIEAMKQESLTARYPEAKGGEVASFLKDKRLCIVFAVVSKEGNRITGDETLKPGTVAYDEAFRRHKFDQPAADGRIGHRILTQYFPGTDRVPVDVADEFF